MPRGQRALSLVTCTTSDDCIVEGIREATLGELSSGEQLSILTTADGGSTWTQSALLVRGPLGAVNFKGLACSGRGDACLLGTQPLATDHQQA